MSNQIEVLFEEVKVILRPHGVQADCLEALQEQTLIAAGEAASYEEAVRIAHALLLSALGLEGIPKHVISEIKAVLGAVATLEASHAA